MESIKIPFHIIGLSVIAIFILVLSSCKDEESKRLEAIKDVMNKNIVDISSYEGLETVYMDSIQDQPCDSARVFKAYNVYQASLKAGLSLANFYEEFFRNKSLNGEKIALNADSMSTQERNLYFKFIEDFRKFAILNNELTNMVLDYKPYSYRRIYHKYRYKDESGKYQIGHGRFYFNERDELEKFLLMPDSINGSVFGAIELAKNRDITPFIHIYRHFGLGIDEGFYEILVNNPDTQIESLLGYSQGSVQTSVVNTHHNDNTDPVIESNKRNEETYNRGAYSSSGSSYDYIVTQKCGAAISKDAEKRFARYSVNGDTDGINRMLLNGELVVLQSGDEVKMLDLGFSISKVRTSRGQTVYVDTEFLSKK